MESDVQEQNDDSPDVITEGSRYCQRGMKGRACSYPSLEAGRRGPWIWGSSL